MPSVTGPVPFGADAGALPFEPPADPVVRRFQEEMAQVADEPDLVEGEGALIKQEGKVYHVRNSATVQRWIVERRVLRDDLISTGGAGWEPVGQHPDLEIFFQMVERLDHFEQSGAAHSGGPPVPDGSALGNAWADRELEDPDESSLEMPDEEEEESDLISAPAEFPGDITIETPAEPMVGLDSLPHVSPDGPTLVSDEEVEDPDSDIAPPPFALRSATRDKVAQPAMVTVPDVVVTEEAPLPSGLGLIGMVGPGDDELTLDRQTLPEPELPPVAPLPVVSAPGRGFDEQAFFEAELEPLQIPDPEPTVKVEPEPSGRDVLAWEEDRSERRMRFGLRIGVVTVLSLIAAVVWVTQLPSGPAILGEDAVVSSQEGIEPQDLGSTSLDPADDPALDAQPLSEAASDKAASDKAAIDKAASDKAASDKAASDKAASDKAAPDKAASDKAASDKAASDKGARDKERRASAEPRTAPKAPAVNTEKGWSAVQTGDYNQARLVFVEAVAARPGDADAHFGLGYSAHRQGDDATAIRHYCKALRLAPGNREIQQEATSLLSSLDATCP
ncbi:MAG: hypothetical protein ACI9VR_000528 [Cognaticolwellia sp.]|jgi:hypothetical protein